jgi:hypothetical protein
MYHVHVSILELEKDQIKSVEMQTTRMAYINQDESNGNTGKYGYELVATKSGCSL